MSNKTNFLIFPCGRTGFQLRIYCNEILVDEIVIDNNLVDLIKTKSMHHEDGNFLYRFELISGTDEEFWKQHAKDYPDSAMSSDTPLVLWHVLHNDHPMSFYVDTLNYTDIGWLKNKLWNNNKAHIYPGQTLDVQLNFRGGNVSMDNEFLLKNIKAHHNEEKMKLQIDLFGKEDTTQTGNLPTEETHFVAVMKNKDLIIKKYENEQEIVAKFCYTEQMIKEYSVSEFMQFVERACMMVHLQNSAPEYYYQHKI